MVSLSSTVSEPFPSYGTFVTTTGQTASTNITPLVLNEPLLKPSAAPTSSTPQPSRFLVSSTWFAYPGQAYKALPGLAQPLQQQVKNQLKQQAQQLEQHSQAVSGHLDTWQTGFLKLGDKIVPHRLKKATLHSVTETMEQTSHRNELDLNALSPFNPVSYLLSPFVKEELMHRILERQQAQLEALIKQGNTQALMVSYMA